RRDVDEPVEEGEEGRAAQAPRVEEPEIAHEAAEAHARAEHVEELRRGGRHGDPRLVVGEGGEEPLEAREGREAGEAPPPEAERARAVAPLLGEGGAGGVAPDREVK